MTCSLFHWHGKMSWGCWVSYLSWMACLAVSRCLEIQRAAGQAGKCLKRGRVAPGKEGKDRCARGMVTIWRRPHGTTAGLGPQLQSVLLWPASHCHLWKGGREEEKCLHLQRGSKGSDGPKGAVSGPTSSCSRMVLLAPWGVLLLSQMWAPTKRDVWLPTKWGGKAMTGFLQLIWAKQWQFEAEALVTVSGQDASLMLNKSSSTALELSQGGRSHLIRPKELTATLL